MGAAALSWEQDLLEGQEEYVQRQLVAGVAREVVVRDLVGMGADANRAKFFVDRAAKTAGKAVRVSVADVDARSLRVYMLWALVGALVATVVPALMVLVWGSE